MVIIARQNVNFQTFHQPVTMLFNQPLKPFPTIFTHINTSFYPPHLLIMVK